MKVIALSTALVGAVFILLSLLIRAAFYFFTKDSLEEVEPNNPLDYPKDEEDEDVAVSETAQTEETTPVTEDTEPEHSTDDSESIKDDEPAQTKDTDEPK